MRILIVEDEVMIREGLAKLIKSHTGHTVAGEASNGQEGLNLALRLRPELVITDIRMPVMDGLQMIEKLHDMNLNTRAVILSGYSEFEYAKKAIYYGVEDYLLKPLAAEDIVDVLERIEKKRSRKTQARPGSASRNWYTVACCQRRKPDASGLSAVLNLTAIINCILDILERPPLVMRKRYMPNGSR